MKIVRNLIVFLLILLIFAAGGLFYYFFFTENGSRIIVEKTLAHYLRTRDIKIEKCSGSLGRMFSAFEVMVKGSPALPPESFIRIQRLDAAISLRNLISPDIYIYNGKLQLAFSDAVLFYGGYRSGRWQAAVYSKQVSVREVLDLVTERSILATVSGTLRDVDLQVRGRLLQPEISGTCFIDSLSNESFKLAGAPLKVALKLTAGERENGETPEPFTL